MTKPLFERNNFKFSMIKIDLELISNVETYLFLDKNMRGRISYISKRSSKANNNYLKCYDPKQESKRIYM